MARVINSVIQPKFLAIDNAASGNTTIIPIVPGKMIKLVSLLLVSTDVVLVRLKSNSTALTGQMSLLASAGFVLPENWSGWVRTAQGEALVLELSGAVSVDGCLSYVEE